MTTRRGEFLPKIALSLLAFTAVATALGACDSQPSQPTATRQPRATPIFIPSPEKLNTPTPTPTPETISPDSKINLPLDGSQSIKLTKNDGSNEEWIWKIKPPLVGDHRSQLLTIQTNSKNFNSSPACIITSCFYNGQDQVPGIELNAYGFGTNPNEFGNNTGSMFFALSLLNTQGAYLDCKYNSRLNDHNQQEIDSFASCDLKYNSKYWTVEKK
jgi:hypothetical protein